MKQASHCFSSFQLQLCLWSMIRGQHTHACMQHTAVRVDTVCRDGPGGACCDERAPGAVAERVAEADVDRQGDGWVVCGCVHCVCTCV